jgi:hypothetical protein
MAALAVLSAYIWLFGITGVIEDEPLTAYADESVEFLPTARELLDRSGEVGTLSAVALSIAGREQHCVFYYERKLQPRRHRAVFPGAGIHRAE